MGKMQRTKGHTFEREIARELRGIFPEARRGLQYRDGNECCDVEGTPFHIECKRGRKPNPRAALEQATNDAGAGRIPIAIIRDDNKEAFACLAWADFKDFIQEWNERSN